MPPAFIPPSVPSGGFPTHLSGTSSSYQIELHKPFPHLSPKSLVRSAAIQPPVSRNPPLVKARSGSAMSEAPPGPQITVISDPAETVETVGEEGRNKRGQGRAERPDTRRYLAHSQY